MVNNRVQVELIAGDKGLKLLQTLSNKTDELEGLEHR